MTTDRPPTDRPPDPPTCRAVHEESGDRCSNPIMHRRNSMSTPHWCKETDRTWRGSYGLPKKAAPQVWLLWHTHLFKDVKLIGIYESAEAAEAARLRLADQPGFKDEPGGWLAEPYEIGKDHWAEGFDTV